MTGEIDLFSRVRKIAVPGTRGILLSRSRRKKTSGVSVACASLRRSASAPKCQVVMMRKISAANTSGTHPPSLILSRLAEKNAISTTRNAPATASALGADHRQREDHHRPVHRRHIDLSVFLRRGLVDAHAGKPAELHGLTRERERSRDDGLARDDGC